MPQELLPQALTAKVYMEVEVVHQAHPLIQTWVQLDWEKILSKKIELLLELALVKLTRIKGSGSVSKNMKTAVHTKPVACNKMY